MDNSSVKNEQEIVLPLDMPNVPFVVKDKPIHMFVGKHKHRNCTITCWMPWQPTLMVTFDESDKCTRVSMAHHVQENDW